MDSDESFDEAREIKQTKSLTRAGFSEGLSDSDSDSNAQLTLHSSTCQGKDADIEEMKQKLEENSRVLEYYSASEPFHYTPLQQAVQMKHLKCIDFMLEAGANINGKNYFGTTALQVALGHQGDELQLVELLLSKGASPNFVPRENDPGFNRTSNLIIVSSTKISLNKLELLLNHGAVTEDLENMEFTTYYFFHTPLAVSIFHCNLNAAKVLLLHGALYDLRKVNACISPDLIDRHSLPHILVRYCTKQVEIKKLAFEMLQQFGVDVQQKNRNNVTTKDYVITMGRNRQATPEYVKSIVEIIDELTREPLTLQSLCRIAIKEAIGCRYVTKLPQLPYLPPQVAGFLKYDEYCF